jgi:hypothetical protein
MSSGCHINGASLDLKNEADRIRGRIRGGRPVIIAQASLHRLDGEGRRVRAEPQLVASWDLANGGRDGRGQRPVEEQCQEH